MRTHATRCACDLAKFGLTCGCMSPLNADNALAATGAEPMKPSIEHKKSRIFYQSNAKAKFDRWAIMDSWKLDEAIALSLGKDPEVITWDVVFPYTLIDEFAKEFERRRDLAHRGLVVRKLSDPIEPNYFLAWAKEKNIDVPPELVQQLEIGNVSPSDKPNIADHELTIKKPPTWIEEVRRIALNFIKDHKENNLFSSQKDVCEHLEKIATKKNLRGAHGKLLKANYIQRNAIQGDWWRENKPK